MFPYRNDLRKTLIPYLKSLNENDWYRSTAYYPNSIAWIISHISTSEDFWVNKIGFKNNEILTINEHSTSTEILNGYIKIRKRTDNILKTLAFDQLNEIVDVPTFSDGWIPPSKPTLHWLFHHVYTHEAYHVGQIAIIARINGFKQPLF
ncbi:DinB family protein [Bacillus aquiflavi]|uniref:DinB family protein n=1 Tax=Bacillus aquiflavi TaxID=2672567 RepID=A0A6B3W2U2_9BACI|nr:DinB family protein [Bacillus aquiflavi]MBA4537945.1 DinB family protein [Bacillus aquiflavi]NEY82201.1 DinB family protein [Bacillus aquiflavi]UAC49274.1 DinB family protein [Bacillus aquiflavi]